MTTEQHHCDVHLLNHDEAHAEARRLSAKHKMRMCVLRREDGYEVGTESEVEEGIYSQWKVQATYLNGFME